jgi:hypothetical protein
MIIYDVSLPTFESFFFNNESNSEVKAFIHFYKFCLYKENIW